MINSAIVLGCLTPVFPQPARVVSYRTPACDRDRAIRLMRIGGGLSRVSLSFTRARLLRDKAPQLTYLGMPIEGSAHVANLVPVICAVLHGILSCKNAK